VVQGLHGIPLVGPHLAGLALAQVILGNLYRRKRLPCGAHFDQAFKVTAGKEGIYDPGIVVAIVPEIDEFAIRKEDERRADFLAYGNACCLAVYGSIADRFASTMARGRPRRSIKT